MNKNVSVLFRYFLVGLLCYFTTTITSTAGDNEKDHQSSHNLSHDIIKRGERLFYGLLKTKEGQVNCASCHVTVYVDTFTWTPSAYELATLYQHKDTTDFFNALATPSGKKLSEVHAGFAYNKEDMVAMKYYLDELALSGPPEKKPVITNLIIFLLMAFLIMSAIGDLIFTKFLKYKFVHFIVIIGASVFVADTLVSEAKAIGRSQGYTPEQPIKFSHEVHVTQNKIDCKYCHHTVENSKSAGIPSANLCMNCHVLIREGPRSGKFEINKIYAAVENEKPIEWVRVHNLPDHAFFSHEQHVKIGKLDCVECHGKVEEMDVVKQVSDLSMGWCIECHRTKEVQFHSNEFYSKYKTFHDEIKAGKRDKVTVEDIGGTECSKCHY